MLLNCTCAAQDIQAKIFNSNAQNLADTVNCCQFFLRLPLISTYNDSFWKHIALNFKIILKMLLKSEILKNIS